MAKYVASIDQGTTSTRCMIFNHSGISIGSHQLEHEQIYPKPGWVEHDPMEIWDRTQDVVKGALEAAGITADDLVAVGITNQRETTVVWNKKTGEPYHNAIVWQDTRTDKLCQELEGGVGQNRFREKVGLPLATYFSGPKVRWMLDNVDGLREEAEKGNAVFGNIDTWLIWNLTGGAVHVTDYSNAARTLMFNIKTLDWDDNLLEELGVPRSMLPEVKPSSAVYGYTAEKTFGGAKIPVAAAIGDQQGALFGQACFEKGMAKNTYGTGSFVLMNTGTERIESKTGLLTTIAWGLGDKVEYALEGAIFVTGAAVQWLRDELKIVADAADTNYFATKVPDTNGVYMVPAFVGLGAPYWDQYARGAIVGLTRGANRDHIVRATLESIAYQTRDVIDCQEQDSGIETKELKVDGGASKNDFLMQFQADILGVPVLRPRIIETTARGSAFLAGLAVGFWKDQKDLKNAFELEMEFTPQLEKSDRDRLYAGWQKAVEKAKEWEEKE